MSEPSEDQRPAAALRQEAQIAVLNAAIRALDMVKPKVTGLVVSGPSLAVPLSAEREIHWLKATLRSLAIAGPVPERLRAILVAYFEQALAEGLRFEHWSPIGYQEIQTAIAVLTDLDELTRLADVRVTDTPRLPDPLRA